MMCFFMRNTCLRCQREREREIYRPMILLRRTRPSGSSSPISLSDSGAFSLLFSSLFPYTTTHRRPVCFSTTIASSFSRNTFNSHGRTRTLSPCTTFSSRSSRRVHLQYFVVETCTAKVSFIRQSFSSVVVDIGLKRKERKKTRHGDEQEDRFFLFFFFFMLL